MINFRFHLVSLVAVFLALGLGILVGSTVIDQGIVNRLDSEINSVRKENSAREATSKQLAKQNSQLQQFVDQVAPFVGDGRLDGQSVALVAERGVDSGAVKQTEQALQQAGADVPAVLWLDDSWQLDSDARVQALAVGARRAGNASSVARRRARPARAPARQGAGATPTSTTTRAARRPRRDSTASTSSARRPTTSSPPTAPPVDVLTALEQAGFLSVTDGNASAFDGVPGRTRSTCSRSPATTATSPGPTSPPSFARALVDAKLPTVGRGRVRRRQRSGRRARARCVARVRFSTTSCSRARCRPSTTSISCRVRSPRCSARDRRQRERRSLRLRHGRVGAVAAASLMKPRTQDREASVGHPCRGRHGRRHRGLALDRASCACS